MSVLNYEAILGLIAVNNRQQRWPVDVQGLIFRETARKRQTTKPCHCSPIATCSLNYFPHLRWLDKFHQIFRLSGLAWRGFKFPGHHKAQVYNSVHGGYQFMVVLPKSFEIIIHNLRSIFLFRLLSYGMVLIALTRLRGPPTPRGKHLRFSKEH
jgi:hypothetical protein